MKKTDMVSLDGGKTWPVYSIYPLRWWRDRLFGVFDSRSVIKTVVVVAIMCAAWKVCYLHISRHIGSFGPAPLRIADFHAELGEVSGRSDKDISIDGPSPKKDMLLSLFDRDHVPQRNQERQSVPCLLWAEDKPTSLGMRESIKIGALCGAETHDGHRDLRYRVFHCRRSAIRHRDMESIGNKGPRRTLTAYLIDSTYSQKGNESALRRNGGIGGLLVDLIQEPTENAKYESEYRRPRSGFPSEQFFVYLFQHIGLRLLFLLSMVCFGGFFSLAWLGFEQGRLSWLGLSVASLMAGCGIAHLFWIITK